MKLNNWVNPKPDDVAQTTEGFLRQLGGPTVLHLTGQKPGPYRVCTTLLHANEPSGCRAIHRLLKEGFTPRVDTKFIIASVSAALTEPLFTHRMLEGQPDLNRRFGPVYDLTMEPQAVLARAITQVLEDCEPEALVDVHNTSGNGPAFTVSIYGGPEHIALASFFSARVIKTDIRLGSLMELRVPFPIVTFEAGGSQEASADQNAYEGIKNFLMATDIAVVQREMDMLHHPRRLELDKGAGICYQDEPEADYAVTLRQDIEKYNFGITPTGTHLGWVDNKGLDNFALDNPNHWATDYFEVNDGQLYTCKDLKLFMVTTQPIIAETDCLFYFCV